MNNAMELDMNMNDSTKSLDFTDEWSLLINNTTFEVPSIFQGSREELGVLLASILTDEYEVELLTGDVHVYSKVELARHLAADDDDDEIELLIAYGA
jgi:hypothetical protein